MKKLILLFAIAVLGMAAKAQTPVRVSSETVGYWTITADTMNIVESDDVIRGSIYNPSYATDSVTITGCTFTIDGIAANGIKIPPGEASISFGFDYEISDTTTIACPGEAWVMLLIRRLD